MSFALGIIVVSKSVHWTYCEAVVIYLHKIIFEGLAVIRKLRLVVEFCYTCKDEAGQVTQKCFLLMEILLSSNLSSNALFDEIKSVAKSFPYW